MGIVGFPWRASGNPGSEFLRQQFHNCGLWIGLHFDALYWSISATCLARIIVVGIGRKGLPNGFDNVSRTDGQGLVFFLTILEPSQPSRYRSHKTQSKWRGAIQADTFSSASDSPYVCAHRNTNVEHQLRCCRKCLPPPLPLTVRPK